MLKPLACRHYYKIHLFFFFFFNVGFKRSSTRYHVHSSEYVVVCIYTAAKWQEQVRWRPWPHAGPAGSSVSKRWRFGPWFRDTVCLCNRCFHSKHRLSCLEKSDRAKSTHTDLDIHLQNHTHTNTKERIFKVTYWGVLVKQYSRVMLVAAGGVVRDFVKKWTTSQGWLLKLYTVVLGSITSDSPIHVCPIWTVSEHRAPQVGTLNVCVREIRSRKQDRDIL